MEFLHQFLRRSFAGKLVVTSRNVGGWFFSFFNFRLWKIEFENSVTFESYIVLTFSICRVAYTWHRVGFASNCTVGLFWGTNQEPVSCAMSLRTDRNFTIRRRIEKRHRKRCIKSEFTFLHSLSRLFLPIYLIKRWLYLLKVITFELLTRKSNSLSQKSLRLASRET